MQENREFHFFNIVEGDLIIIDLDEEEDFVDLGEIYDDNNVLVTEYIAYLPEASEFFTFTSDETGDGYIIDTDFSIAVEGSYPLVVELFDEITLDTVATIDLNIEVIGSYLSEEED